MHSLFDAYLIVDWSANNAPKTGKDSIWWCHMAWKAGSPVVADVQNPATRLEAFQQIKSILLTYKDTGQRVLVGFDFAYGYPAGFAEAIAGDDSSSWFAVWRYLHAHIRDDARNANNRFEVAANINQLITGVAAPFWGCPAKQQRMTLSMRKPVGALATRFREFRLAEEGNSTKSVWQLSYPGAVGSQALMGIPYVYALRTNAELEAISCIWPFETGLKPLGTDDLHEHRIIHAEVYPSLVKVSAAEGEIKDKLQVMALAEYFAELDRQNQLGPLFAGGRALTEQQRQLVETEEGWILGV